MGKRGNNKKGKKEPAALVLRVEQTRYTLMIKKQCHSLTSLLILR